LKVHAYTFRQEHGEIPAYATSLENLLEVFFVDVGIDGVFTDFPDQAVEYLESRF
jgi:glycerophosphoryl diester phosphodiesterase